MMFRSLGAFVVLLALTAAGSSWLSRPLPGYSTDTPMTFTPERVDGPESGAPAEIWRPEGAGPFPAVVLLHGCGGAGDGERDWAKRLVNWGYVGVILDSFRPRHLKSICGHGRVSASVRSEDLLNLIAFLRTVPEIDRNRIGVIGFSAGASAAMIAAGADQAEAPAFQALVAYYPSCRFPESHLVVDTLILAGAADTLLSIDRCRKLTVVTEGTPRPVPIETFPGAEHNFDRTTSEAATRSYAATRAFMAARLTAR
jgi:dienelactone hydrolase